MTRTARVFSLAARSRLLLRRANTRPVTLAPGTVSMRLRLGSTADIVRLRLLCREIRSRRASRSTGTLPGHHGYRRRPIPWSLPCVTDYRIHAFTPVLDSPLLALSACSSAALRSPLGHTLLRPWRTRAQDTAPDVCTCVYNVVSFHRWLPGMADAAQLPTELHLATGQRDVSTSPVPLHRPLTRFSHTGHRCCQRLRAQYECAQSAGWRVRADTASFRESAGS